MTNQSAFLPSFLLSPQEAPPKAASISNPEHCDCKWRAAVGVWRFGIASPPPRPLEVASSNGYFSLLLFFCFCFFLLQKFLLAGSYFKVYSTEIWNYTVIQYRKDHTDISERLTVEVLWFERFPSVELSKLWWVGHLHENYLDDSHTYWPPSGLWTHNLWRWGRGICISYQANQALCSASQVG